MPTTMFVLWCLWCWQPRSRAVRQVSLSAARGTALTPNSSVTVGPTAPTRPMNAAVVSIHTSVMTTQWGSFMSRFINPAVYRPKTLASRFNGSPPILLPPWRPVHVLPSSTGFWNCSKLFKPKRKKMSESDLL